MGVTPPEVEYTWSNVRVAEQVAINVITWLVLAILAAIVASLGLFVQWLSHYIVVPTNILVAVVCIGLGVVLTLGILIGTAYLYVSIHPEAVLGILGGLLVAAIFISWRNGSLAKTVQHVMEQASTNAEQHKQGEQTT